MGWFSRIFYWLRATGRLGGRLFTMLKGHRYFKWLFFSLFLFLDRIVGKLLMLLGVSFVVNKYVTPNLTSWFASKFTGMSHVMLSFVGLLRVDQAITIIMSAAAIAAASNMQVQRRRDALNTPL